MGDIENWQKLGRLYFTSSRMLRLVGQHNEGCLRQFRPRGLLEIYRQSLQKLFKQHYRERELNELEEFQAKES